MKLRKSFMSLFLVIALLAALFAVPVSADDNRKVTNTIDLGDGIIATTYQITGTAGSTAGKTVPAASVEFKPGEYIPLVFANNAGWRSLLSTHYNKANERFGYEVVAAMNGSFFSMANGYLNSMFISNGRVSCAHAGLSDDLVVFMPDGTIETVKSCLSYRLMIDGVEVPAGLGQINKFNDSGSWNDKFYYFDVSCGSTSDSAECDVNGTELICKKLSGTDLVVGGTMLAEVVEVKKDSKGNKFALDNSGEYFALFVKNGSSLQKYADVEAGASIEIAISETVEESREIMEKASSAIANIGWLVKGGVDQTQGDKTIGTHSVTLCTRWTALGIKEDGTVAMFATDNADDVSGISMRDVAKNMLELGYTNVIRFDGGGSSALYVNNTGKGEAGFLVSSSRSVSDCVLLVKKSSLENEAETARLKEAIDAAAETLKTDSANEQLKSAYEYAVKAYGEGHPTYGEAAQALTKLAQVGSSTIELDKAINAADRITYTDYSAAQLAKIYAAYNFAKAVRSTKNATSEVVMKAAEELNAAISLVKNNVALGKSYTGDAKQGGYAGNLTDGVVEGGEYDGKIWNGVNERGKDGAVTLDLGKIMNINGVSTTINSNDNPSSISAISKITIEFSTDGKTFNKVAELTDKERLAYDKGHVTISIPEAKGKVRYIRYSYSNAGSVNTNFIMVSEIAAYEGEPNVEKAGFVTNFNTKILTGMASVFTPDFVTDFAEGDCNIRWTHTAFLEWDAAKQGYKIISFKSPNGKDEGTLKEGQIALAVHNSEVAGDTDGSAANRAYLMAAKVGDYVEFHGIYIDKQITVPGSFYKIVSANEFDKNYNGVMGNVSYDIPTTGEDPDEPKPEITGLTVNGDIITGLAPKVTVEEFKAHFKGDVTVDGVKKSGFVGTGCTVTYFGKTYTVVLKGDTTGDGKIDTSDYVAIRKYILKIGTLDGAFEQAAHVKTASDKAVGVMDYVAVRKFILGLGTID